MREFADKIVTALESGVKAVGFFILTLRNHRHPSLIRPLKKFLPVQ